MSETLPESKAETAAIRRLAYSDLPSVISIERRSFPAPWSLAMFVLELSKPTRHLPGGDRRATSCSAT